LKEKVKDGKKIIVDRGYISNKPDKRMLSQPSALDSKELSNFKSWAHLRQETFNGRLKYFNALAQNFRHTIPQHELVLEAVCVIVQ
jgi:cytochrome oxidase assembly protein ShyY1